MDSLTQVAGELGVNPDWLSALINFESSWNPEAYNAASGAVGLIQFIPRTLKSFGFIDTSTAALVPATGEVPESVKEAVREDFLNKYPDEDSQLLGPVLAYFKSGKPYPTEQSLDMQVFFPRAKLVAPETRFEDLYQDIYGAGYANYYSAFAAQNPGIDTVQDYLDRVKKKVRLKIPWWRRVALRLGLLRQSPV